MRGETSRFKKRKEKKQAIKLLETEELRAGHQANVQSLDALDYMNWQAPPIWRGNGASVGV
jgi:hypothetical protein